MAQRLLNNNFGDPYWLLNRYNRWPHTHQRLCFLLFRLGIKSAR